MPAPPIITYMYVQANPSGRMNFDVEKFDLCGVKTFRK